MSGLVQTAAILLSSRMSAIHEGDLRIRKFEIEKAVDIAQELIEDCKMMNDDNADWLSDDTVNITELLRVSSLIAENWAAGNVDPQLMKELAAICKK